MKARAATTILFDILLFGAVLLLFALFHHALPTEYEPLGSLVLPTSAPMDTSAPQTNANATAAPTSAPAPGDFSASFPTQDTGTEADVSYQNDELRIAITGVQENGVAYFVADAWVKNIELFRTAFAGGAFSTGVTRTVRKMAEENGALLAVSGDFCGAHKTGAVIRNGVLYREENGDKDVCVLYYDGTMEVIAAGAFSAKDVLARGAWQAWSFGPNLLANGKALETFTRNNISKENPRCAIGYYEPGHYCLVIVDGRQVGYSEGLTLIGLSQLMESLGCKAAYNLDGGATATMVYDGELVNAPAGGGRASSDIIYFALFAKGD